MRQFAYRNGLKKGLAFFSSPVSGFAGCFRTVIQQADGTSATVKTPCDSQIWLMQKKYGKPSQTLLSDSDFRRIRYYYASTRTEYEFAWNDVIGCQVDKHVHLTGDGIQ